MHVDPGEQTKGTRKPKATPPADEPSLFAPPTSTSAFEVVALHAQPVAPAAPVGHQGPPSGTTIAEAFLDFHNANPGVYKHLVRLARRARQRGANKIGIGMLFEVLRWQRILETGGDVFKLNNNYRALYARLIMERESDLAGMFEIRELHTVTPWTDRTAPADW